MFWILLFFSVFPVFFIGRYIYTKDSEREPLKFVFKLFFCGIGSFFLTLIISYVLSLFFPTLFTNLYGYDLVHLFFNVFLGIALVEEFSKWIFVYKVSFNSLNYDQFYDMIVYAAFVSLGFACLENILYVFENGLSVAFVRALLAVPGHACDGVFMGYYLSQAKIASVHGNDSSKSHYLRLSLFVPVCLHGFYDYCLFSQRIIFIMLFFVFIISLYIVTIRKIGSSSRISGKIVFRNKFCPNCGTRVDGNFCSNCGRKNE